MIAETLGELKFPSPEVEFQLREKMNLTRVRESTRTPEEQEPDNEEDKISRVLRDWLPDYTIVTIVPREHVPREPVFSGRLGRSPRIQRAVSTESIATQLSLLSCSTGGKRPEIIDYIGKRRNRRKKSPKEQEVQTSKWVELANRRTGIFDKMFKSQAASLEAAIGGGTILTGNPIYDMLADDEKTMVFECGLRTGLNYAPGLQKSDSVSNVAVDSKPVERRFSVGARISGKPINFQELQRKAIHQKIAMLAKQMPKTTSKKSQPAGGTRLMGSYSSGVAVSSKQDSRRSSTLSAGSCDVTLSTPSQSLSVTPTPPPKEARVNLWKGDEQILEMDLRRELTSKVKSKIATTTSALNRVTGYGDNNDQKKARRAKSDEFPGYTDEDFGRLPRMMQKIRISPHLSQVIQQDIKVRMGRPRYHEISVHDMELWDRGQKLDRSHRNLKVFNWLHSLREDMFDEDIASSDIEDEPTEDDMHTGNMIHIEAADEPNVKPLFERMTNGKVLR
ncbi:uncharacterized protein LOC121384600 [Gigantopelta aegis]|uniref:uncharacterized protein LOC121384600 n=1 Tax=Gigantopelta aegis TaxID=1735272 RepID=UPI001B88DE93|nr:uncharacterized protein LOC121384600 [Gigantopelta aegis]XP_041370995.1 uncharacterized protein LOC121384600 [Gigantopelta aegis]